MAPPFEVTATAVNLLAEIERLLGQYEGLHRPAPTVALRKSLRVRTVQGSVAIEGNTLTPDQVTALIDGQAVIGSPRDVLEAKNAISAYQQLNGWRPEREEDLLKAHGVLMTGLLPSAGKWRRSSVGVFQGAQVVHVAPPSDRVPHLVRDTLKYLTARDQTHPIIKSAILHYGLAFIHPFEDGNGRIARLWHTLTLYRYHPIFEFVPIESVIQDRQSDYFAVLGECDRVGSSTRFIEFALLATRDALTSAVHQMSPKPATASDRLAAAETRFGREGFSRKDYLSLFPGLSTATASRDLKKGVDQRQLRKSGEKSQTRYQFLTR